MRGNELLLYAYGQIQETLRRAVQGLTPDELTRRVGPEANTIAWLARHLARVQDDHGAEVAGSARAGTSEECAGGFGLPFPVEATGCGFSCEQVAQVRVPANLVLDYAG